MWDLPRPGLEPMSPALAGRFSTTTPPGKPNTYFLLHTHHEQGTALGIYMKCLNSHYSPTWKRLLFAFYKMIKGHLSKLQSKQVDQKVENSLLNFALITRVTVAFVVILRYCRSAWHRKLDSVSVHHSEKTTVNKWCIFIWLLRITPGVYLIIFNVSF